MVIISMNWKGEGWYDFVTESLFTDLWLYVLVLEVYRHKNDFIHGDLSES